MFFCFVQKFLFRTTQELEYNFFVARNFFPEFNIRLYGKNSESDLFSLHQNQNISFRKKNITPLEVKWSVPNSYIDVITHVNTIPFGQTNANLPF